MVQYECVLVIGIQVPSPPFLIVVKIKFGIHFIIVIRKSGPTHPSLSCITFCKTRKGIYTPARLTRNPLQLEVTGAGKLQMWVAMQEMDSRSDMMNKPTAKSGYG